MQKSSEEIRNIVRQNALSHAVEVVKILSKDADSTTFSPKGMIQDVTGIAKEFEEWVMRTDKPEVTGPMTTPVIAKPTESQKACPKCGEQIPAAYTRHFRCGWSSIEAKP